MCGRACGLCHYQTAGDKLSLDFTYEDNDREEITMGATLANPSDLVVDIVADSVPLDVLTIELAKLPPDTPRICQLYQAGHSERQIAGLLGIPRSSFKQQWDCVKAKLKRLLLTTSKAL